MKRVALVFVLAVLAPSLVLAWLAVRSLRDQQFVLERQQSLLDQRATDTLAQEVANYLAQQQQEFSAQVENLAAAGDPHKLAAQFDDQLRRQWPLAEVGFCVTTSGKILSPPPNSSPAAQMFRLDNSGFLGNREPVEVYLSANNATANAPGVNNSSSWNNVTRNWLGQGQGRANSPYANTQAQAPPPQQQQTKFFAKNGSVSGTNDSGATTGSGINTAANANSSQANRMEFAFRNSNPNSAPPPQVEGQILGANNPDSAGTDSPKTEATPELANSNTKTEGQQESSTPSAAGPAPSFGAGPQQGVALDDNAAQKDTAQPVPVQSLYNYKATQSRKVSPQSQMYQAVDKTIQEAGGDQEVDNNLSRVVPAEAEFRQLVGDQNDGMLARFLQNKLKLMCWHRLSTAPDLIFGAQLNLDHVADGLRGLIQAGRARNEDICLAILDDNAKPVVISQNGFQANWKRPFVATEIGDALPHWEAAGYLINPGQLRQTARTAKLTLGLLVAVLMVAIGTGSVLIVRSLDAELKSARQKTDFVGNVSHELKTPLTSIRMFSELLAEGRVADTAKQHSYLQIITAEAARLTRLINNVLDFSRMERGEKKYAFQACDLAEIARTSAETFRPHLESAGFRFETELPAAPVCIRGDADALSQIIVNLLSNAEKYSNGGKEISLLLALKQTPLPHAEIRVLDRGPGVPKGSEEKVFEKFYRAHDSLSSGVQGSGLGLTIARQIAQAHGGDVVYEPRDGGGSCFVVRLPVQSE